jgi:hypothetical protein
VKFLSVDEYKPVMLEIISVKDEEGKGTCVNVYFGFMSNKHIYACLPEDIQPSDDFPKYIRVKRGKTECSDKRHYFPNNGNYAIVRGFEFPEGTNFSEDKHVSELDVNDPAIYIIKQIWNTEFRLFCTPISTAS